ncbi:Fumagillin beta-trans-bergamotene synthase [Psilocybe cubensis]|uniref:UbiA prenyltransferase family-domain-containing protein n=2 Tax=Psilocybe cubensis TaxID=181762 RepID=A0A8H7XMB4_PSICU|nr:Fumagillin beta-trans-bergamotene synthase [Psilocybe cubensis]KAH9483264.1 Fumagillin beta-trans-bergamotene synthase [Psilocybe cubensis]
MASTVSTIVNYLSSSSIPSLSSPINALNQAAPTLPYNIFTLWLFIKSDIVGIIMPIVAFATFITSNTSPIRAAKAFTFVTLHLLQFCISNQSLSPEEDAKNKPWRPIPAGRLSVRSALILRWFMLPACLLLSAAFGVLDVGIVMSTAIFLHNECGYDAHWFPRTALNAIAYTTFDTGAILISLGDRDKIFEAKTLLPLVINASIILTTIHAQDFRDLIGDIQEGRSTIPIVLPKSSRASMPVLLVAWMAVLMAVHQEWNVVDWAALALGTVVGLRFYFIHEAAADQTSYTLYNVWLIVVRVALVLAQDSITSAGPKAGWIDLLPNEVGTQLFKQINTTGSVFPKFEF